MPKGAAINEIGPDRPPVSKSSEPATSEVTNPPMAAPLSGSFGRWA